MPLRTIPWHLDALKSDPLVPLHAQMCSLATLCSATASQDPSSGAHKAHVPVSPWHPSPSGTNKSNTPVAGTSSKLPVASPLQHFSHQLSFHLCARMAGMLGMTIISSAHPAVFCEHLIGSKQPLVIVRPKPRIPHRPVHPLLRLPRPFLPSLFDPGHPSEPGDHLLGRWGPGQRRRPGAGLDPSASVEGIRAVWVVLAEAERECLALEKALRNCCPPPQCQHKFPLASRRL